jgi:hypothetical protein
MIEARKVGAKLLEQAERHGISENSVKRLVRLLALRGRDVTVWPFSYRPIVWVWVGSGCTVGLAVSGCRRG